MELKPRLTNKRIVAPRTHSTADMYKFYVQRQEATKKRPTPYWMYKEVLARFNKKASDAIIFGQTLNLGNRLGYILIRKIRRNYENPIVDWGASKRIKQDLVVSGETPKDQGHTEGKEWIVYFDDPWYLRWAWIKRKVCKVRNHTVYKFLPTSNRSRTANNTDMSRLGNKGKLALANKLNSTLHLSYESLPGKLTYKTKEERKQKKIERIKDELESKLE